MAVAAVPGTTTAALTSVQLTEGASKHRQHDLTRVGSVSRKPNATLGLPAGTFAVWYCQNDDELFITILDP